MSIDHNYARGKLKLLLRDLSNYNAGEFWREMSRIASGATASIHAEGLKAERDALADSINQLMQQNEAQISMNAKLMHERDALAAHVDRITGLCRDLDECELGSKEMANVWNDIQDAFLEEPSTSLAGRAARSNCPDCEGDGNIAFVTCPICDGEGKLSSDEVARLHAERLAAPMDSCELECGAYGTYCKCAAEAQQ